MIGMQQKERCRYIGMIIEDIQIVRVITIMEIVTGGIVMIDHCNKHSSNSRNTMIIQEEEDIRMILIMIIVVERKEKDGIILPLAMNLIT